MHRIFDKDKKLYDILCAPGVLIPPPTDPHIFGWPWLAKGILFILNGPPGVGKDSVAGRVHSKTPLLKPIISWTTRPRGSWEPESHEFVSEKDFLAEAATPVSFVEQVQTPLGRYGTRRIDITHALDTGHSALMIANTDGMRQTKASLGGAYTIVTIFLMPPSWRELVRRIEYRRREDGPTLQAQLRVAEVEIPNAREYDYVICNHHFDGTVALVCGIITAETVRASSVMSATLDLGERPE